MKYIIILLLTISLISCSNETEYESSYYQDQEIQKDCIEPENPYDEGSGHYAGYEWGLEGNDCSGNSDSFIEGCEEYYSQENDYESCNN